MYPQVDIREHVRLSCEPFAAADAYNELRSKRKKEQHMNSNSFFILWAPSGTTPPKVRFSTYENALKESERMSDYHQKEFFIMKAVSSTTPVKKTNTVKLREQDGVYALNSDF